MTRLAAFLGALAAVGVWVATAAAEEAKTPINGLILMNILAPSAESRDAAKCEAAGKERLARREKIREACKDKRGEDLKACIREHRSPK